MTPPPPPGRHDGPFVNDHRGPGLLRRLLGGGTHDPTSPHDHQADPSTSTMHDSPAMPTRRATTTTRPAAPAVPTSGPMRDPGPTAGGGMRMPWPLRLMRWVFRTFGLRLTIAAVAGLLVLVGSIADQRDSLDRVTGDLRDMNGTFQEHQAGREPTPPPAGRSSGALRATVDRVQFDRITLREADGTTHRWVLEDTDLFGDVLMLTNQRILASWDVIDGDTTLVAVRPLQPQPPRAPAAPAAPAPGTETGTF